MPGYPIPAWPSFDPRIAYPAYRPPPPMYLRQPPMFWPAPVPCMMPLGMPCWKGRSVLVLMTGPPPHYPPVAAAPGHTAAPPAVGDAKASSSSAPAEERPQQRSERSEKGEKGEKGKGKGKTGKERGKREGEKERPEHIDRSDDPRRQAVEQVGEVVTVLKHSSMGCAVVSMTDTRVRQAIVAEGNECTINGLKVEIKPHHNKDSRFGRGFGEGHGL
eukprot:symbB.v1.2.030091.t1/scaffold3348.1/size58710/1